MKWFKRSSKNNQSYNKIWDAYVVEDFPRIKNDTPFSKVEIEEWRVLNTKDDHYDWPGDEWGDKETAEYLLDGTLTSALDHEPEYLCEFGAGAGRYTTLVFERFKKVTVLSFDVSLEFQKSIKKRCAHQENIGQLQNYLLNENPKYFINTIRKKGLTGKIDAIYSYDAMVHVDLHTLFVYWASAAVVLKPGGILAMSVADACNDNGFTKLIYNASGAYQQRGSAGPYFMWISKEIVESTLTRLGFEVSYPVDNGRDIFFTAKLVDPEKVKECFDKANTHWLD